MAVMIRTSTGSSSLPPTLRTTFSWRARSSFTCMVGVISPISSRNRVPRSASWKSPFLSRTAPVKAPRSWPKSSLSSRFSGIAPQLIDRKRRVERGLAKWMARAISSLPVPLSPWTSTVEVVRAMRSISEKIACIRPLLPMMLLKVYFCSSSRRR